MTWESDPSGKKSFWAPAFELDDTVHQRAAPGNRQAPYCTVALRPYLQAKFHLCHFARHNPDDNTQGVDSLRQLAMHLANASDRNMLDMLLNAMPTSQLLCVARRSPRSVAWRAFFNLAPFG